MGLEYIKKEWERSTLRVLQAEHLSPKKPGCIPEDLRLWVAGRLASGLQWLVCVCWVEGAI